MRRAILSAARADDVGGLDDEADAAEMEEVMAGAVQHHSWLFPYLVLDTAHIARLGQSVSSTCDIRVDCAVGIDARGLHGLVVLRLILRRSWRVRLIPKLRIGVEVLIEGWVGAILRELRGVSIKVPTTAEKVRAADDEQDYNDDDSGGCITTGALLLIISLVVTKGIGVVVMCARFKRKRKGNETEEYGYLYLHIKSLILYILGLTNKQTPHNLRGGQFQQYNRDLLHMIREAIASSNFTWIL